MGRTAVVTDSTAGLPSGLAESRSIMIVPLRVLAGSHTADDGPGVLSGPLAEYLSSGERLTTARPSPARFAAAYAAAAEAGAAEVVSVHLSGELSGTLSSAELAAAEAPVPVHVVDSRSIGMGLGITALTAAAAAAAGLPGAAVAAAARLRAERLGSFLAVDSPDQLRAGGWLSPLAGPAGAVLTARPLLTMRSGRISMLERVRTRSAAAERLAELAAQFAAGRPADIAVQHIGQASRAAELAGQLAAAIPLARHRYLTEAGAAILAHTGPGMLGVVVAPC